MLDIDKWQEIIVVLQRNKLRTFLTSLGVLFGILILVTLLAIGKGFENKMQSSIGNMASNSAVFWTQKTSMPYKGLKNNRRYAFTNEDITLMKLAIPEIANLAPQVNGWTNGDSYNTFRKDRKASFSIKGTSPEMDKVSPVDVLEGRQINFKDVNEKRKVIAIGTRVVDLMYSDDDKKDVIGSFLRINGIFFKVVGIVKPLSRNMGMNDKIIQMPYKTVQAMYNRGEKFHSFWATAKVGESVELLEDKIFYFLARRHNINPKDKEAIGHLNIAKLFKKIEGLFVSISALFWLIGFGVLITGIIGLSNIMLVVVKERTREIGIKRALGASPASIVSQIVTESILLTSVAGFVGLFLGVLIVEGINSAIGPNNEALLNPYVDIQVASVALLTLIVFGCLAGLLPAKKAISIKPVDALRYE